MWRQTIDLYKKHEPQILTKYPWLEKDVRVAKRRQALMMAGWYSVEEYPQTKEEVRRTVLAFSPSRRVRAKIALGDLGFGPAYVASTRQERCSKTQSRLCCTLVSPLDGFQTWYYLSARRVRSLPFCLQCSIGQAFYVQWFI
jgi:hypothetical protein